ncbi:MAG: hypothetical protein Q8Q97_03030 [bacterium]|nr:hypothetical protein [bacterium]
MLYLRVQVVKGLSEASALMKEARNQNFSYSLHLGEGVPLAVSVALDETFEVPIKATVPIKTTVRVPVTIPILGQIVTLTVPIDTTVPVDLNVKVPVKRNIPIKLGTPLSVDIPVNIPLRETSLGVILEKLDALLTSLAAKL